KDPEVELMINRMFEMSREIKPKLEDVYSKGKHYNFDVARYMEYIRKSFPNEYAKILDKESELRDRLLKLITPESCVRKIPKSNEKLTQERKGKLRGMRKNWIPMK